MKRVESKLNREHADYSVTIRETIMAEVLAHIDHIPTQALTWATATTAWEPGLTVNARENT